jgi:ketosteroid isomerase-like protein
MELSDERVVRALFAAFTARDLSAALALVDHEAFRLDAPTAALARGGAPYRGAEGLRAYLEDVDRVWTRLEIVPQELIADRPGRVIALGRVWAQSHDRAIRDSPTAWLFELRAGRVVRATVFPSASAALAALEPDAEG